MFNHQILLGWCFWRQPNLPTYQHEHLVHCKTTLHYNHCHPCIHHHRHSVTLKRSYCFSLNNPHNARHHIWLSGQSLDTTKLLITRDTNSSTDGNSVINSIVYKDLLNFHTGYNYIYWQDSTSENYKMGIKRQNCSR